MLILGHMDVVEAKREDWKYDPFVFREEGGYFLGRGASDMKNGDVATTMAAVKLMSKGSSPIATSSSSTAATRRRGIGATLGASEWRNLTDAEFGLNADGGCAAYDRTSGRSDAESRPPKRPSRPISSRPIIRAVTALGRGRTMRSTSWPMR